MLKFSRPLFAAALLASVAFAIPAQAQDANSRIDMLEEQLRQLTGQVEELTFMVKQLQAAQGKMGAAQPQAAPQTTKKKTASANAQPQDDGIEQIESTSLAPAEAAPGEEQPMMKTVIGEDGTELQVPVNQAPKAKVLGTLGTGAAQSEDGGFQGQVLVPLGVDDSQAAAGQQSTDPTQPVENSVEQVALAPETPEALYERSNESLLRRQFSDAESGFRDFLQRYPDHSLAGSAQYWLGETYYAQGDFHQAAQNFMTSYQQYPKARRAPESLLKLGMALGKLGQKDQACAALLSVSSEYPKAVDAKKRAATEAKRAGC